MTEIIPNNIAIQKTTKKFYFYFEKQKQIIS